MGIILGIVLGVIAGLLANYISPPFKRLTDKCFGAIFYLFNPDRFDLTGTWEQTFKELAPPELKQCREVKEKIRLNHIGNVITGSGETDIDTRKFRYQCQIRHNLFFGFYNKIGERGNISGSGMVQLIISPDRLSMEGQATWYDEDTKNIESSHSVWRKIS